MRWTDARKTVDAMVANGTPIKLANKELDAVYAIARTAQSVIYSVELERLTAAFRKKERKVNRDLKKILGQFVYMVDTELRKEVGAEKYDEVLTPFFVTSIRVSSSYSHVTLHGEYACKDNSAIHEHETYELRDIKTNKIIFRQCQVSQTTEKLFRKKYTVGTMSVLPYVWV
jgi:hypothetical protein